MFVANALESLEIDFRACIGSMKRRDSSIQEFKSGNVPILILSSEDSVSGLNLTEASHVVIFHPFLIDSNGGKLQGDEMAADTKMALSIENQVIFKAWRSGQRKQVEVVRLAIFISNLKVRFLARDSIEEELATQRGYSDRIIEHPGVINKVRD
jgi:hypothetical protein